MSEKGAKMVENLSEMFRCFICMQKLNNAHLCPHCSKLTCYSCIVRWFEEGHSHCAHCRAELTLSELVVCRWVQEVTDQLDNLQLCTPQKARTSDDFCLMHIKEKLKVFCVTCHNCICSECALWTGMHSGHSFIPLEEVYDSQVRKIDEQVELTKRRHMHLIGMVQQIEKQMTEMRTSKDNLTHNIHDKLDLMLTKLNNDFDGKFSKLLDKRNQLTTETEMLDSLLMDVEIDKGLSKKELINKAKNTIDTLVNMNKSPLPKLPPKPTDFVNEIVPSYVTGTFKMANFSRLQTLADPVYSTRLHVSGLVWRLKVYPDGNGSVRHHYLSVFLELSYGRPETSKYEYRIEMVHPTSNTENNNKNIVREYASDFEVGECWGYNRFIRLDLLRSEGYIEDDDTLTIKYHVRPPTYLQKCRDLLWYNGLLEESRERNKQLANKLKKKLGNKKLSTYKINTNVDDNEDNFDDEDDDDEADHNDEDDDNDDEVEDDETDDEDYGFLASTSRLANGASASLMVSLDRKLDRTSKQKIAEYSEDIMKHQDSLNDEMDIETEQMFLDNNVESYDELRSRLRDISPLFNDSFAEDSTINNQDEIDLMNIAIVNENINITISQNNNVNINNENIINIGVNTTQETSLSNKLPTFCLIPTTSNLFRNDASKDKSAQNFNTTSSNSIKNFNNATPSFAFPRATSTAPSNATNSTKTLLNFIDHTSDARPKISSSTSLTFSTLSLALPASTSSSEHSYNKVPCNNTSFLENLIGPFDRPYQVSSKDKQQPISTRASFSSTKSQNDMVNHGIINLKGQKNSKLKNTNTKETATANDANGSNKNVPACNQSTEISFLNFLATSRQAILEAKEALNRSDVGEASNRQQQSSSLPCLTSSSSSHLPTSSSCSTFNTSPK